MRLLISALMILFVAFSAKAADWSQCRAPGDLIAACFTHDDGGALYVMCDAKKKLMSILLIEPRATWQKNTPMNVITRASDGKQFSPSHGIVVDEHMVLVVNDSTWDISTMGDAKGAFIVSAGDYARVFPTANFRKAVDPVMATCGDHF